MVRENSKVKIDKRLSFNELFEIDQGHKLDITLHDWCVSRQRFGGTPLPIIECERCGEYPNKYLCN